VTAAAVPLLMFTVAPERIITPWVTSRIALEPLITSVGVAPVAPTSSACSWTGVASTGGSIVMV
jgi:hypothetical protein